MAPPVFRKSFGNLDFAEREGLKQPSPLRAREGAPIIALAFMGKQIAAALLAVAAFAGLAAAEERIIRVHYTPKDQQIGRYQHVPFDVPAGTTRIDVAYRYDKAGAANVIDLGLLEPGPLELGTPAFRGWTGGERDAIFVAADSATPGYWPGPIPPGRWHVQLGLYKVGLTGVDVEVTVTTAADAVGLTPGLATRPGEPIRRGAAWYSGGLHAHTVHSDGKLTPQELASAARADGLDFLVITDHNNTAHQLDAIAVPDLLVIPGEEVTTPGGHLNVWGLKGARALVDFRVLPGDPAIQKIVDAARSRGALASINHPYQECFACTWTHMVPEGVTGIEIANRDAKSLVQSIGMWDVLLRQGRRITAVGASDFHRTGENPIGTASVRVWAEELSTPAILGAIGAGRVVVMADGRRPPPSFEVRSDRQVGRIGDTLEVRRGDALEIEVSAEAPAYAGGRVDLIWRGEPVASAKIEGAGPIRFTRWANTDGYLRVHAFAANGAPLAVTNPVFVKLGAQ